MGGLSFFGGGAPATAPAKPVSKPTVPDTRAADAARAAEARREALEQKRQAEEEKRRQAAAAAEEKRQQAAATAEAKRSEMEQKRLADEEKRKQATAQAETRRKEAEQKKAQAARAKQAQASVETAKPRATFSLASLFGGSGETKEPSSSTAVERPTVQPKKMASPPRGTPIISDWKQNRDGSVTGRISGGRGFTEGERVTTSPIGGNAIGGAVVQTSSGSK